MAGTTKRTSRRGDRNTADGVRQSAATSSSASGSTIVQGGAAEFGRRSQPCPSAPLTCMDSQPPNQHGPREFGESLLALMPSSLLDSEAGGGSNSSNVEGGASGYLVNLLSVLAEVEAQRDGLQDDVARLEGQLEGALAEARRVEAERLRPEALRTLTLPQLQAVEVELEVALRGAREAVMLRRISDAQAASVAAAAAAASRQLLQQQQRPSSPPSSSSPPCCSICLERPRSLVFNCGHQSCGKCGEALPSCPFCRAPITARIKMFDT